MTRIASGLLVPVAALLLARAAAAGPEKTAAETMKNVQVLKDVPISEWSDTMAAMSYALGVNCQYCHVGNAFEKDDQKAKQTARAMIEMTRELNRKSFAGQAAVACYTCHQGSTRPKGTPALWTKPPDPTATAGKEPPAAPESLPDADRVFARYREAIGAGELKSLRLKGAIGVSSRPPLDVEIDLFPPDRFTIQANVAGQQVRQVFDTDHGWIVTPAGVIQMTPMNVAGAKRTEEVLLAVKFASPDAPRKTVASETIGDRTYTVLESRTARQLERLYFDPQSGLLFRRHAEVRTGLGIAPTELSFEDYRDVNGVKLPYRVTARTPTERTEYKFSEIQTNVALDPARFAPPRI